MIGVNGVGKHSAIYNLISKVVSHGSIVDTPAFITDTGTSPITPPAIRYVLRVFVPEGIGHRIAKPAVHPGPFFRQEARRVFITYRIMDIDGLMSDVVIAHNNQFWSGLPKRLNVVIKITQELHLNALTDFAGCSGREVTIEQGQVAKVSAQDTAFAVINRQPATNYHISLALYAKT